MWIFQSAQLEDKLTPLVYVRCVDEEEKKRMTYENNAHTAPNTVAEAVRQQIISISISLDQHTY